MKAKRRTVVHYSESFKQKVISEIESGKYTQNEARHVYGIGGGSTISNWLKRYGKNHLLSKIVRVEMRDEKDRFKALETRERELEKALADAHLKVIAMETLIEEAEDYLKMDLKKNFGSKAVQSSVLKHKK